MNALTRKKALLKVISEGNIPGAKNILDNGGDVNAIYPNGKTLLTIAIEMQDKNLVEFLIASGANVDQRDFYDRTPLMYTAEGDKASFAQTLIDAGADINARNKQGRTALMHAVYKLSPNTARVLLEAGADVYIKDKNGQYVWDHLDLTDSANENHGKCSVLLSEYSVQNDKKIKEESTQREPKMDFTERVMMILTAYFGVKKITQSDEFSELKDFKESWAQPNRSLIASAIFSGMAALIFIVMTELLILAAGFLGIVGFLGTVFFAFGYNSNKGIIIDPVFTVIIRFVGVAAGIFLVMFSVNNKNYWLVTFNQVVYLVIAFRGFLSLYPSIIKVFLLGYEFFPFSKEKVDFTKLADPPQSRVLDNKKSEVDFVSHLMDLGINELSAMHVSPEGQRSIQIKKWIFYSHIISAIIGLSNFVIIVLAVQALYSGDLLQSARYHLVFMGWFITMNILEYRLLQIRLRLAQKDRDRIAGELSNILVADDFRNKELPLEFGLYLRAFMTTDKLHINGFDFETVLAYSIAPTLPLIALGQPGEHLGSGRIQTTDEHWQDEILRLMDNSRLILIIPSHRAGTLWEINTLRNLGYFKKTIFIMPPELDFHGDKFSTDWNKTVDAAQELNVEFPNHIPAGAFFRLGKDGEIEDYSPFHSEAFTMDPAEEKRRRDAIEEAKAHGPAVSY